MDMAYSPSNADDLSSEMVTTVSKKPTTQNLNKMETVLRK